MQKGVDPSRELGKEAFKGTDILFTSDVEDLRSATFYIVAVPTPVNDKNEPELSPLLAATRTVAQVLKKGDCVVFESTVYPGSTEEDCVPLLESISGLKFKKDFKVGYSPERINPGDKVHTLKNTVKIVSGCDSSALARVAKVYSSIVEAGVHKASSIKVAEAAKITENIQRDVNIALMNELSMIFDRIGINTYDVLEAAGTKWNFLNFLPGLVGGHCIGVDPYYLVYKAQQMNCHAEIISAGRSINDSMGGYIGKRIIDILKKEGIPAKKSRILVLGITFKENVSDIRNSKVVGIIEELKACGVSVDVYDPYVDRLEVKKAYGVDMLNGIKDRRGVYDAVVVAVSHKEFRELKEEDFIRLSSEKALLVDVKGIHRGKISKMPYWSL